MRGNPFVPGLASSQRSVSTQALRLLTIGKTTVPVNRPRLNLSESRATLQAQSPMPQISCSSRYGSVKCLICVALESVSLLFCYPPCLLPPRARSGVRMNLPPNTVASTRLRPKPPTSKSPSPKLQRQAHRKRRRRLQPLHGRQGRGQPRGQDRPRGQGHHRRHSHRQHGPHPDHRRRLRHLRRGLRDRRTHRQIAVAMFGRRSRSPPTRTTRAKPPAAIGVQEPAKPRCHSPATPPTPPAQSNPPQQ